MLLEAKEQWSREQAPRIGTGERAELRSQVLLELRDAGGENSREQKNHLKLEVADQSIIGPVEVCSCSSWSQLRKSEDEVRTR